MTRVAFLFLGETLLIPHLYPMLEALAAAAPEIAIDAWVATSVHEGLVARWSAALPSVRVRRVPGFRRVEGVRAGDNPPLPAKLPMLARLVPHLFRTRAVVCVEQTSLWIPTMLPMLPTRFIKSSHGVGSMSARDDRRRRSPWLTMVPSERERATYLSRGMPPQRIVATGYVKAGFRQRTMTRPAFAEERPVLLYTPHWQRHRSSWWNWGEAVVRMLAQQRSFNVILAPHQRLAERDPGVRDMLGGVAALPHVHVDLDSFATVDGSYTAAADLYLGDTSSQVIEFLQRPRPCVFLNPGGVEWRGDPAYAQWGAGEVVDTLDFLPDSLARAQAEHPRYAAWQSAFAAAQLGPTDGLAPERAARHILAAVRDHASNNDRTR